MTIKYKKVKCPTCGTKIIASHEKQDFCPSCGSELIIKLKGSREIWLKHLKGDFEEEIEKMKIHKKVKKEDSEILLGKLDRQISELEENPELIPYEYDVTHEYDFLETIEKKKKKSLLGGYYTAVLQKKVLKGLSIIGGILGCILSIIILSKTCAGQPASCWADQWWWIPLSTFILGPIGMIIIALLLPLIPIILYVIFMVIISIGS